MKTFCIYMPRAKSLEDDQRGCAVVFEDLLKSIQNVVSQDDSFSLEIFCKKQIIYFLFTAEKHIADIIKSSLYNAFPVIDIKEVVDPLNEYDTQNYEFCSTEMYLKRNDIFSVNNYTKFEFNTISGTIHPLLSYLQDDISMIQIICTPFKPSAFYLRTFEAKIRQDRAMRRINFVKYLKSGNLDKEFEENAKGKILKDKVFKITIRVASLLRKNIAPSEVVHQRVTQNCISIARAFEQYNTDFNSFCIKDLSYKESNLERLKNREHSLKPYLLSTKEIATIWGIPNLNEIKNTPVALSIKVAPPPNLPTDINDPYISFFAKTDYRDTNINFGIHREDRRRHLYLVGKSGMGKSSLMKLLAKYDIVNGAGLCVIDPHGDLVDNLLSLIPKNRIEDVVIFDTSDISNPISFNPFCNVSKGYKSQFVLSFTEIFKKSFSSTWNENLEVLLRYIILALIESPFANFADVRSLLTNKSFRVRMMNDIKESAVRNFWLNEYEKRKDKQYANDIVPLLEKIDSFANNAYLKNIFSQSKNKLDFREIIDNNKIFLIKISKGLLGDENASILGSMLVFKIYHAAMSRADIKEEQRKDFYLYVDEFQSFMTESFKQILSEARKYRLNLTMAHQYLGQIPKEMIETIFGNIANLVIFGMGAQDCERVANELENEITKDDIMNLAPRQIYVKMSVNSVIKPTFSATTLDVTDSDGGYARDCKEYSRKKYCSSKDIIPQEDKSKSNNYKAENYREESPFKDLTYDKVPLKIITDATSYLSQNLRCYGTVLLLSYLDIPDIILNDLGDSIFSKVEEVDLKGAEISNNALKYIAMLPSLIELNLDGTTLSKKAYLYLQLFRNLEVLSLNNTEIGDDEFEIISTSNVYVLNVRNTFISNESIKNIIRMKNLIEIDIRGTLIDEKGIFLLKRKMPNLLIIK